MNQVVEAESQRSTAQATQGTQVAAFLEKLDASLEQQRQALATAEAHLIEKKALCAAFPDMLPMAPYSVDITPSGYRADAELVFEVTSRDEVLQLLDVFETLPAMMLSSGCTSFIAEERFTAADAGTKVEPIGDVIYRISHWVGLPQEEYSWWTRLTGKLVHVTAKTKQGHAACSKVRSTAKMLSSSFREVTYNYENLPDGVVLTWHGGDARNMAPVTVHQPRGRSFRDALAKPMVAYAKVKAYSCDC